MDEVCAAVNFVALCSRILGLSRMLASCSCLYISVLFLFCLVPDRVALEKLSPRIKRITEVVDS
jgi:hypothetical protein